MRLYKKRDIKDANKIDLPLVLLLIISLGIFALGFILLDGDYTFFNLLKILHEFFLIPFIFGILLFSIAIMRIYYLYLKPSKVNKRYVATLLQKKEEEYCNHKITNMTFVYSSPVDKITECTCWYYSLGSNDYEINQQYLIEENGKIINIKELNGGNQENRIDLSEKDVIEDIKNMEKQRIKNAPKQKPYQQKNPKQRLLKTISNQTILWITIIFDILLFILFENGIDLLISKGFLYTIQAFGYASLSNLFAILGIELILLKIIDLSLFKKKFPIQVTATCIGNDRVLFDRDYDSDGRNTQTYTTSWEYVYNNQICIVKNSISTNFDIPKIGSERTLYISGNSFSNDYYDPIFEKKMLFIHLFVGSICIFAYIGLLQEGLFNFSN